MLFHGIPRALSRLSENERRDNSNRCNQIRNMRVSLTNLSDLLHSAGSISPLAAGLTS